MKIGIYTIFQDNNYGALLQAYATQKAIKKIGYDSEFIKVGSKRYERENKYLFRNNSIKNTLKNIFVIFNPHVHKKSLNFKTFRNLLVQSKTYESFESLYSNPPKYDLHIVGSDQVWNLETKSQSPYHYYFLDFLDNNSLCISYASSFGASTIHPDNAYILNQNLKKFKAISVREDEGVDIINKWTGLPSTQVMDPTFLLNKNEWEQLAGETPIIKGNYILAYGFANKHETNIFLDYLKEKYKLPIVGISVSIFQPFHYDIFYQEAGPAEFLNLIRFSTFVVTASFHGAAFAIHFRKNFFLASHSSRNSRNETLLRKTQLLDQFIDLSNESSYKNKDITIDYSLLEENICQLSRQSYSWLQKTIKTILK